MGSKRDVKRKRKRGKEIVSCCVVCVSFKFQKSLTKINQNI